jgi:hypothetical protein
MIPRLFSPRGFLVLPLGGLCLLQASPARAQCAPARMPPSAEYLDLVTRFVSGDPAPPLAALAHFDPEKLRCDLENLSAAALAVSRCREKCEDRAVFERFPVRGALLLHAAREITDQFPAPVTEQSVTCSTGPQAQTVEHLASILLLVDPDAKTFLGRFYVSMIRRAQWSLCIPQAEQWARTGLKRLPGNPEILNSLGIVLEATAFFTLVPSPRSAILGPPAIRQLEAQTSKLNAQWERARRAFEDAVAKDPGQHEARLRLGRVQWRLHRAEPARTSFEAVLREGDDPVLLYLAHLFLGRIHEDEERLGEAEEEYQAALKARPVSEAAAVAISHVRLLTGDTEGAREFATLALDQVRKRVDGDPYKNYFMAHTRMGQSGLEDLRKALVR